MASSGSRARWTLLGEPFVEAVREAIDEVRQATPLGPVTVVTPSLYSAFFLRRRLAPGGLFNVAFERIEDIAERLARPRESRRPLSRLRGSELVYLCATDASIALPARLERIRDHPSFVSALHSTLNDLRVAPQGAMDRLASGEDEVSRAIGSLAKAYRDRSQRFADRLDVSRAAAAEVEAGSPTLDGYGRFILLWIDRPVPEYRDLQDSLRERPTTIVIAALTGDEDADALLEPLDRPTSMMARGTAPRGSPTSPARPTTSLEDTGPQRAISRGARLVSAPDPATEVRWVLRDVVSRCRGTESVPLGRMAVLYENPEYGARVHEAFSLGGVPVAGPEPRTLDQQPEGRWVIGLLHAAGGDLARDAVMAWLTGSPVRDPATGSAPPSSRWDAVSKAAGVTRGAEAWTTRLKAYASACRERANRGLAEEEVSEAQAAALREQAAHAQALQRFMATFAKACDPPEAGSSWAAHAAWLGSLYERYLHRSAFNEKEEPAVPALLDSVSSLDELGGEGTDLRRLAAAVTDGLTRPAPSRPNLGRGVFVAPLRAAAGCDFDVVYILGMGEGGYPSRPPEDPLLPDRVRLELDPSGSSLSTQRVQRRLRRRRYLAALATAHERVLLWPRAEAVSKRPIAPARWFVESARARSGQDDLQGGDLRDPAGHETWLEHVPEFDPQAGDVEPASAADAHEYDLRSAAAAACSSGGLHAHYLTNTRGSVLGRALQLERSRAGRAWTEFDGNLTLEPPRPLAMPRSPGSPTRLQTWATCPFQYLLSYVLRVTPIEAPEARLTIAPADRGALVHAILDRFVKTRSEKEGSQGPMAWADQHALLMAVFEQEAGTFESYGIVGIPSLWRLEKERLRRDLSRFLKWERGRRQRLGVDRVDAELSFGMNDGDLPPVKVDVPGEGVLRFRGKIDRVEFGDGGRTGWVLDYKTGSPRGYEGLNRNPLLNRGRLLQLPVYALAVQAAYPEVDDVIAGYWFVSDPASEGDARFQIRLSEADDALESALRIIAGGIRVGVYPARPGSPNQAPEARSRWENCSRCDFDRICPSRRDRQWERKRETPELTAYRKMAEE